MTHIRVASVPSDHVYVRHIGSLSDHGVVRLLEPAVPGQWSPSRVLDVAWLQEHREAYDLVHVHFGFEHLTTDALQRFVATLRRLDKPLVLTVHDLVNPHLHDQGPHLAALDALVPAASTVITLTRGAAREIAWRWGRTAHVLAHPHVVDLPRMAVGRSRHDGFAVAVHDKARANCDAAPARATVARALTDLPGARLVPSPSRRLTDAELWDHLAGLDALVLPYSHGTHSGFVEACHDLGTTVIAPRVGYFAEQQRVLSYDAAVAASLADAVRRAHRQPRPCSADPAARARQREDLATAHRDVYARALAA
jgi:hypothetical protein